MDSLIETVAPWVNDPRIVIGVLVVLAIGLIISIIKKAAKLAIVLVVISLFFGSLGPIVNTYIEEHGIDLNPGEIIEDYVPNVTVNEELVDNLTGILDSDNTGTDTESESGGLSDIIADVVQGFKDAIATESTDNTESTEN